MNMKLQILQCILTGILSTSTIMPSTTAPAIQNTEYLPIVSYQQNLSDIISNYVMSLLYKQNSTESSVVITEEDIPVLSREEALESMKLITTKIFDVNDTNYLSSHLLAMKKLSQNLDPESDIKTIGAIHFLLENQHRSSIVDTIFWMKANNQHEFDTAIPVNPDVASRSKTEKLSILHKKMASETKKRKEESKASV